MIFGWFFKMKRWLIPSKEKTERPAETDGFRGEMFSAACLSCGTRCAYFWWSMGPSSLTTWLSVCICLASLNVWMDLTCHCKVKTQASCQWVIKVCSHCEDVYNYPPSSPPGTLWQLFPWENGSGTIWLDKITIQSSVSRHGGRTDGAVMWTHFKDRF